MLFRQVADHDRLQDSRASDGDERESIPGFTFQLEIDLNIVALPHFTISPSRAIVFGAAIQSTHLEVRRCGVLGRQVVSPCAPQQQRRSCRNQFSDNV